MPDMRLHASTHPLIAHWISELREESTAPQRFRSLVAQITRILVLEASADLKLGTRPVQTPLELIPNSPQLNTNISLVSIMRAGNAMLDAALGVLDFARCGHIGLYRQSPGNSPVEYFFKLPKDIQNDEVWLLDPMLATGSSAEAALLKLRELQVKQVKFLCLVAAPEGLKKLEVLSGIKLQVFAAAVDRELNSKAYILPGLGDAGDRIYGTAH